ncbi:MAG: GAF domain-containing protein [Ilumatobacteraceae bacterium]
MQPDSAIERSTSNLEQAPRVTAVPGTRLSAESLIGVRLHVLVDHAAASIDGASMAGLSVDLPAAGGDDTKSVLVAADEGVWALHAVEIADGDGPGLTARRTGEVIRISSTADDGPWEMFREACRSAGIMSTASFAVTVGGQRVGVLNVYSDDYHAFDVDAIRAGRQIAREIAAAIETDQTTAGVTR